MLTRDVNLSIDVCFVLYPLLERVTKEKNLNTFRKNIYVLSSFPPLPTALYLICCPHLCYLLVPG